MPIDQITDHQDRAKARLPGFMQGAINIEDFLDAIVAESQNLETVFFQLLDERHLSVAVGAQLDGIGEILAVDREVGQSDADYRTALIDRNEQLAKGGEIETLLEIFIEVSSAVFVTAAEYYPAGMLLIAHLDADTEDSIIDQNILSTMNDAKAGGVELDLRFAPETEVFSMAQESETDGNNDGPQDADEGFGDEALPDGGGLARAI